MITRRRHHNRTSRVQDSAYNGSALRFATERDDCTPRRVDFATGFRAVVSCRSVEISNQVSFDHR